MATLEEKQASGAYTNLVTMTLTVVLFLTYLYLFLRVADDKTGLALLGLLGIVQLTPGIVTFSRKSFNYLVFALLNHFIVYTVSKYNLLINVEKSDFVPQSALNAITEMIYCTLLMILSYYFCRFVMFRHTYQVDKFELFVLNRQRYLVLVVYTVMSPVTALWLPVGLLAIHATITGAAMTLIFCSTSNSVVVERWSKLILLASAVYSFLISGSLAMLVSIASVVFVVAFIQWKTSNFIMIGVMVLLGTMVQTVKGEYRFVSRSRQDSGVAKLSLLTTLVKWKFTGEIDASDDEVLQSVLPEDMENISLDTSDTLARGLTRLGDDSLERVLEYTPSRVPYWNGETYSHIPFMFIPRLLWPGKPKREMWNRFGRAYEFISEDDGDTSVGINFLGEAYMNFGFTGLYSMALLFGFLMAAMEVLSFHILNKQTYFAFMTFLIPFMNYGLDFSSVVNSIVLVGAILLFFRYRLMGWLQRDLYAS